MSDSLACAHARESAHRCPAREALAAQLHVVLAAARDRTGDRRLAAVLGNSIVVGNWRRTATGVQAYGKAFGADEMERAIAYVEGLQ